MQASQNASTLLKMACGIARADLDLACESNRFDRMTIISNAVLLLILGVVAFVAWTAFWSSFLPLEAAIPLGLLVGSLVLLIDQAISASDWELAGVLRTAPRGKEYWFKVIARALIAFLLALATATGATLWMFSDTIEARLQAERTAKNAPVEAEYARLKAELKTRLIKPLLSELEAKQRERDALQIQIEQELTERDQAYRRASKARIEAGREIDGGLPGYVKGDGPRYREAKRQEAEAMALAKKASEDVHTSQSRMEAAEKSIAQFNSTLVTKEDEYRSRALELDNQKMLDPRWSPLRNDPLMRYMALRSIQRDPDVGQAATEFGLMMTLVLLTLELSFLFIKVACSPASVYVVRLIARAKREAALVSAEYARTVNDINRGRPRGNLRVVGGEPDQPEGEQS